MSQTVDRPEEATRPAPRVTASTRRRVTNSSARRVSLLDETAEELLSDSPVSKTRKGFFLSPITRVRISAVFLTFFALAIILQLFNWQVQKESLLKDWASKLRFQDITIPAKRGIILDSNGLVLASNVYVYSIYASPRGLSEKQADVLYQKLTSFLPNVPPSQIKDALTYNEKDKNNNKLVARDVDSATYEKIKAANLQAISFDVKSRRVYPNNNFMSPLLGFVNYENPGVGAYGIEGQYNSVLSGTPGKRSAEIDGDGNPILLGQVDQVAPVDGGDVTLTIDSSIQYMVQRELLKGMQEHQAEKALAIVEDPQTGAVLAWVSFPNYDPNQFFNIDKKDAALFRDPNVSEVYEPGSTFKILTAAIGIDTGAVTPDSAADLPGCVIKYGRQICNYNSVGYAHQTVVKTLEKSSNVGAMWIAEKFGPDKYYNYLQQFGIGQPTNIGISGEVEGIVRPKGSPNWSPLDFMENSFGQSIAVTPIQLVQAVSAVANGGKLMKPYIVDKVSQNGKVTVTQPTFIRQVIKPESAKTTTDMLVQAVRTGETRLADVKGYRVAGKTGTATLYDSNFTIGSTIAYAPADNPRFIVLVRYDKTKDTPWGSNTAAPVVKAITEQLFDKFNIPPTEPVDTKK
ncbi:MAG TPA: penicillin-binding protein 2 [Chloroflexia bacterium]|nr:penicillin-binding protein 2 [Chloroflexia bacterium]